MQYYVQASCYYGRYRAGNYEAKSEQDAIKQAKACHKNRKLRGFVWQVVNPDVYYAAKSLDPDYPTKESFKNPAN